MYGLLSAISYDGINFVPENDISLEINQVFPFKNMIMSFDTQSEIACIFEDKTATDSARYKMLITRVRWVDVAVTGLLFSSEDLINWKESGVWSNDGEPLVGVFYNKKKNCHTIIKRPGWGVRLIGYTETTDFKSFSDYSLCLQQDSMDAPLEELYGMPSFEYDGI